MKDFYRGGVIADSGSSTAVPDVAPPPSTEHTSDAASLSAVRTVVRSPGLQDRARARIAVYDAMTSSPRIEDLSSEDIHSFIDSLSERTYTLARERGGRVPYSVVREVAENLLHASFADVVVSILDDGSTIRFSDRGPGISDKDRAFRPGFTTATETMRSFIRGVGSGLPIVRESVGFSGGVVEIEDNLERGTVVTVSVPSRREGHDADARVVVAPPAPGLIAAPSVPQTHGLAGTTASTPPDLEFPDEQDTPVLGVRQKRVLSLVMELGSLGPTIVSKELHVGLSTAYRDLAFLEEAGLLSSDSSGKRVLTSRGIDYLDSLMN